ncbi:MAG: type II toxin-antitoxin system RelB/DinJ family antitoxin [Gracilibacteraceae bacterium]|nr:type II toxin-antitoxin system RelB/DinJ family antitoxin [Gracilibacteraceae bacterium]
MAETRLSVRIDSTTKRSAESVFNALGMTMSTGINIFLTRVAQSRSIPFALEITDDPLDVQMRKAASASVGNSIRLNAPIALFDDEQNRPYLEYPDGKRSYELK